MARKKYSLAVMIALWLLALYTCFKNLSLATIICIILLTALLVAALEVLHFKNLSIFLHIASGLSALYTIIFAEYTEGADILIAVILCIFYILVQFLLKNEQNTKNDNLYLYGVILFAILCVLSDSIVLGRVEVDLFIGFFSIGAIFIAALYGLLFYKVKLKPFIAYISIGLCLVLTIGSLFVNYRYSDGYTKYTIWDMFPTEFFIQLVLLGGYILFDVLRKKVPAKSAEAAPGQAEPSLDEKLAQLEELQTLREAGVLTEEEFQTQKQKILGGNKHV